MEPIFLLIAGKDLGSAFWPMAIRTLDATLFLREYREFFFATILLITPYFLVYHTTQNEKLRSLWGLILGITSGLFLVFLLLNYAYIRDAFVLLPTIYGFVILYCSLKIWGIPENIFEENSDKFASLANYAAIIMAIYLITPGIQAFAGLSPKPPALDLGDGDYLTSTTKFQYPMPQEVEDIRGDIEGDIDFSIYLTTPVGVTNEDIPLAIIFHGFANPGFSSYVDWSNTLAQRGIAVAFVQYPSDVWPEGHDTYTLLEKDGMSNHPFHVPRTIAIYSALEYLVTILPTYVDTDHLLVGGHSLGAGYSFIALDWALSKGWGSSALFVDLEASYARPVQEDLQVDMDLLPDNFLAHVAISEDDMSVSDCFSVHHQKILGEKAILIHIPSDRHGFPRLVATHYIQATETHDDLADWGFYRRAAHQADWLFSQANNDQIKENNSYQMLIENENSTYMGEWSDGQPVKNLKFYSEAINDPEFEYCKTWTGP